MPKLSDRCIELVALFVCLLPMMAGAAPGNMALVIGNSAYQELRPLANAANDASAMAEKLRTLGFVLIGRDGRPADAAVQDLTEDDFHTTVKHFAEAARAAKPEIVFFYYAGHGIQFGARPYLLPVDVPQDDIELVERHAIDLEQVLRRLDDKASLVVTVFDACREIPELQQSIATATRDIGLSATAFRGLARVNTEGRSRIVAYSAAAGQLAADGSGRHSPYTEILLHELDKPSLEVGDLFRQVAWRFGQSHGGQQPELLIQGVPPERYFLKAPNGASTSQSAPPSPPTPLPLTPPPPPLPPIDPVVSNGHLQISTNTPADIRLDGRAVGEAAPGRPLNLSNLPIGEHEVEVSAAGYLTRRERHRIQAKQWTQALVALELEPASEPPPLSPGQQEQTLNLDAADRERVQYWLDALGFDTGIPDGVFGRQTREAITAYQASLGMPQTGHLTRELVERLGTDGEQALRDETSWMDQPTGTSGSPTPTAGATAYAAVSQCSMTGAMGSWLGETAPEAIQGAIGQCVQNGGVPDCCRSGARTTSVSGYSAIAHCGITGATGTAVGQATEQQARYLAVAQCVQNGGVANCCEQGVQPLRILGATMGFE